MTTKLLNAEAKISDYEAEREVKRVKKESFTVKDLLHDLGLHVPNNRMNRFGSEIKKKFDAQYPGNTTFLKNKRVAFRAEDRVILERLVLNEHRALELRTMSAEAETANAGVDLEKFFASDMSVAPDFSQKYELMLEPQPPVVANVGVDLKELETQL